MNSAFNGETFIFTHLEEDAEGIRLDVHLARGGMLTGTGRQHLHPNSDKAFTMQGGRPRVMVDGAWRELGAGDTLVVPRGMPHLFCNGHDGETLFTTCFRPAHDHLRFFLNMGINTARNPHWYNAKGEPPLVLQALALHAYRGHAYGHGMPVWLQKLLFAALAPVALLQGYSLAVPPRRGRH